MSPASAYTETVLTPSDEARAVMLSRGEGCCLEAEWNALAFFHYEVAADRLADQVPFELDLLDGRALISLVAFRLENMGLHGAGRWGKWCCRPFSDHHLLNLRTYVRHRGDRGIHFISEWMDRRINTIAGPLGFGLPYRYATMGYDHSCLELEGQVNTTQGGFTYRATHDAAFGPVEPGSRDEFLLERYIAYNNAWNWPRRFRVWHEPWRVAKLDRIEISDDSLLRHYFPEARLIGAHYSKGSGWVWMGPPRRLC